MTLERRGSRSDLFGRAGMRSAIHIVSNWKKWTVHVWMIGQKLGIIIFTDLLCSAPQPLEQARHTNQKPNRLHTWEIPFKVRSDDTRPWANIHDWLSKMNSICAVAISWHLFENLHNTDTFIFCFVLFFVVKLGTGLDVIKLLWPQVANKLVWLWKSCMCDEMCGHLAYGNLHSCFHAASFFISRFPFIARFIMLFNQRNWIPWCSRVTVCLFFSRGESFLAKGAH